ncbi:PqiC family protein [Craterilacuibacter sp.]|uniref:PqiC family protein n=1 Tax=Craterilacuibacter sp. TaxID=2870909 RepID=UPI003F3ADD41
MKRSILLFPLLLTLAACSSAPKVSYYLLQDVAAKPDASSSAGLLLDVKLPDYLSGPAIVYQTSEVEVNLAQYHQWAESPDKILARNLAARLSRLLPAAMTTPTGKPVKIRLTVEQFNGSYQGHARLAGRYSLLDEKGTPQLSRPFDIRTPQQGDGYDALVAALSVATAQLAAEIARAISPPALTAVP